MTEPCELCDGTGEVWDHGDPDAGWPAAWIPCPNGCADELEEEPTP